MQERIKKKIKKLKSLVPHLLLLQKKIPCAETQNDFKAVNLYNPRVQQNYKNFFWYLNNFPH